MNTAQTPTFGDLPVGRAPAPVAVPHFPDALHAVVWRNWDVVDAGVLAETLAATPAQLAGVARSMGLPPQRRIDPVERRRTYMTVLRRNWHLLPYAQIGSLLGWDAAAMQFALNEDDFMWVKLGGYKPRCPTVRYAPPDAVARARAAEIRDVVTSEFGDALVATAEPPFGFIDRFAATEAPPAARQRRPLRMVYPYFLRYGDPLAGDGVDDIPPGYLAALAAAGVNAVWLQAVLNTLAPWDLAPHLSAGWEARLTNLARLVDRCAQFGIDVMLYLNEPRAMTRAFYDAHPELRGVDETPERAPYSPDVVALCTSTPAVQEFLVDSVRHVFSRVPRLGGAFAITFSENLTNCYSREYDAGACDAFALRSDTTSANLNDRPGAPVPCPRCAARGPAVVNAEVCALIERGMREAGSKGTFLLYAWSTPDAWFPGILERLPKSTNVICISEWGAPFTRGDHAGIVNEYSISIVGPSEQSRGRWRLARERGLRAIAKMQAANTYELSSVPYVPALRLVAQHLKNVADAGVDGIMLGWTAGGSPSPNLDLVAIFQRSPRSGVDAAMAEVARARFGDDAAADVVRAWHLFSDAYALFPFDLHVCYSGPQSLGPANLLHAAPTGFAATMCTFPFDDLDGWRGPYSADTFESQFARVANVWQRGTDVLDRLCRSAPSAAVHDEWRVAAAIGLHFRSTVNQIRFVRARRHDAAAARAALRDEIECARQLLPLVDGDSRIGFEATNQYAYTRLDLVEKVVSCRHLLAGGFA